MAQGVKIPLTMTDQTRSAINSARNNVKRLAMDANKAGQSIGRAGGVLGAAGGALGSAAGGRLGQVGGALGGMLQLGPLGLALGAAVGAVSMFTKSMEESANEVQNQIAGQRAMRAAEDRGRQTVRAQASGAVGSMGIAQQAAMMGLNPSAVARTVSDTGLAAGDIVEYERARQRGLSQGQLYAAFVVAEAGMVSMAEALKAARSLGRNATPEDILLRARGEQLTSSARADAGAQIERVQRFRSAEGFRDTLREQRIGAGSALSRDISNLSSGATAEQLRQANIAANDPLQAERKKTLDELMKAYGESAESWLKLYKASDTATRLWNQAFGGQLDDAYKQMIDARTQFQSAQAQ